MNMKKNVNPVVAVLIAIVVLVGVGFLSLTLFGGSHEKPVVVKKPDMSNTKYQADKSLTGNGM